MWFDINWLAVLVAVVLYQVLGAMWYGPLMGKAWMKEVGKTPEDVQGGGGIMYLYAVINGALTTIVLANVLQAFAPMGLGAALMVALVLWLGFVAATSFTNGVFAERSRGLWLIDGGYHLLGMLLATLVLTLWA